MNPRLIALDWGTSNLRASLLGHEGKLLDSRSAPGGVMAVQGGQFAEVLLALCGDWIAKHATPLIASGMVGSRQGWREAPYLPCPARRIDAASRLTQVPVKPGVTLHIAPGLSCVGDSDGQPDVMRGEETQLWGAALPAGSCCVLPGTHSKWAWISPSATDGDAIERFETHMTGELYAVMSQHSILGRLMRPGPSRPDAFERGARLGLAQHPNLTHALFTVRSAGLMENEAPEALPDVLSGMLIGAEIGGAVRHVKPTLVTLLGDAALCERYAVALQLAGITTARAPADATTRGQWQLACDAGLVEEPA